MNSRLILSGLLFAAAAYCYARAIEEMYRSDMPEIEYPSTGLLDDDSTKRYIDSVFAHNGNTTN